LFALYSSSLEIKALRDECERFAAQFEAPLKTRRQPHRNLREQRRRLKVGYVSPDFRRHAVAYFIEPILANHERDEIEVCCYYNRAERDDFTARLARYADRWLDCARMTDEELAGRIRADGIDILVDLSGHTAGNRMLTFARKPAPIQITYLGCPGASTGLAAMDYRLTDAHADPAGSEAYYTEALLRLPGSQWCYRANEEMPRIVATPARQNGYVTFGSFHTFSKITRPCIELWAQLLHAVPESRLLMVTVPQGAPRDQLKEQFGALGVPAERLQLYGKLPQSEFLRTFQLADIALDPFPATGATTMCEALCMGVPAITLVGTRCMSRMGFSVLSAVGLQDLAAATPQEYVRTAMHLAQNLPRLEALHAGLRARVTASPLADGAKFTRNLEGVYREVWTEWCKTTS
jgi:predicted O-linked N-acetylglucosamine transferase (SPINDLY family)